MAPRPHFQKLVEQARRQTPLVAAFVYPCDQESLQLALSGAFAGYINPTLVGPEARQSWVSGYCGDQGWVDLDPTNDQFPSTDHITSAWGRDYSDVAPLKGVYVGGSSPQLSVSVDVEERSDAPSNEQAQTQSQR